MKLIKSKSSHRNRRTQLTMCLPLQFQIKSKDNPLSTASFKGTSRKWRAEPASVTRTEFCINLCPVIQSQINRVARDNQMSLKLIGIGKYIKISQILTCCFFLTVWSKVSNTKNVSTRLSLCWASRKTVANRQQKRTKCQDSYLHCTNWRCQAKSRSSNRT